MIAQAFVPGIFDLSNFDMGVKFSESSAELISVMTSLPKKIGEIRQKSGNSETFSEDHFSAEKKFLFHFNFFFLLYEEEEEEEEEEDDAGGGR